MQILEKQSDNLLSLTFGRFMSANFLVPLLALVLLVGCQQAMSTDPTVQSSNVPVVEVGEAGDNAVVTSEVEPDEAASSEAGISESGASSTTATTGAQPIRLTMPAINFVAEIEPMAWRVTEVEGSRQAVWEVPTVNAGWHLNSAMPGTQGNMILSGHHLTGGAVFASLARGEVVLEDQIMVTDANGQTFVYQVSELAEPMPVSGASENELARMAVYQAPSAQGKLTLITGWPDFSATHYLFIVADLIGEMD